MPKTLLYSLLFCLLSTLLSAEGGVYIFKSNASRSDSSAKAGNYRSFSKRGAITTIAPTSGSSFQVTKFQPLVFLPHIDPYKHGIIRVSNLEGFKATYNKYALSYNKYSKARPYLQSQMDSMADVVAHLKNGDGYYQGEWMSDKSIDTAIALGIQAEVDKKRKDALVYLDEMELLNSKVYKEVTVKKKLHDKILFNHKDGAASAKYDQLPSSLRKELGVFDVEGEVRRTVPTAEVKKTFKRPAASEESRLIEAKEDREVQNPPRTAGTVVKYTNSSSDVFDEEIKKMADVVSKAMHVSGKKRVVFGRLFFNGGKTTAACSYVKRKVAARLLNDSQIKLFDRDDIAARFEEDKLVFALKGEGVPELATTDIILTGELIALEDISGVALSLRLIDMNTGELLASPIALLPISDGLASRMQHNGAGALSSPLTAPKPEDRRWMSQLKAKIPNASSKVIFSDLPPCSDSQKLQLRLTRAFLLAEMKAGGVKLLEREFLYLIGGDPLAMNEPLDEFLKGDCMFVVKPESSGNSDIFLCSARLTSSEGHLLYMTEFMFDYIANATEAGSLAEASLEDALKEIQRDAKANAKSKLLYTKTWTLGNGCSITKSDWGKFNDSDLYREVYKIDEKPFKAGNSIRIGLGTFQEVKGLNWPATCREVIRRLAIAQKSDASAVKNTFITCIVGGFSLRDNGWGDEGIWKDSNWLGLWPLLLNDALSDWTLHSSGTRMEDNDLNYEIMYAAGDNFPQRLLYNHVLERKTSHRKVPNMPLPRGSYQIGRRNLKLKLNYEIAVKWKGLLPSEVKMTIDLTPSKDILYKVKK